MKHLFQACALILMSAVSASAQQGPVVVELFTSQGCSSCPPADAILHELTERDDVIALALHVDYWDYIGWKDEFADPRNAERQREYARVAHRRSVYTPQMIVMGQTDIVGAKPMALAKAIATHRAKPQPVRVGLSRAGQKVQIRAEALKADVGRMVVHLLRYQPEREARITRGENAGRTIQYANVTEGWTILGEWDGKAALEMNADAPGDEPIVVILQAADSGPIHAAAVLE